MKVKTLKENNLNCMDFINCLIALGYTRVKEVIENEKKK